MLNKEVSHACHTCLCHAIFSEQKPLINMASSEFIQDLFKCLNESNDKPLEMLVTVARLRKNCWDAIISEFSAKKTQYAYLSFCEVSRLQFPSSQRHRAGELQPVR